MRKLLEKVKSGDRVVDLGAGCFGPAQYLVEKVPLANCQVFAVDYSHTAKGIVQERLKTIHWFSYLLGEAIDTPLRSKWFDVVIAGELIEHIENPADLTAEMARLTKPGGWMVISTVDTHCGNAIKHGPYPEHIWEFEPVDLIDLFAPHGDPHYEVFGDYHVIECKRASISES
jgi:2-polyprenyl-3-methyl-5-hydroxy-6-metoxy-1,4-benzoquinol methylase